jgi:ABC-2 type transport system permease protein
MKTLIRTLNAEILKLRRTLAFWLAIIAPLITVGANAGMFLERGSISSPEGVSDWMWYGQLNIVIWGLLMIPLFVTLETALVGNMEHTSDHWKHLNALPVPRGVIYAAKQFSGMMLIALSSMALVFSIVADGLLLKLLRPGIGLELAIPWGALFAYAGMTFLGAWLIISIQTWISLRWKSFVVACAAGIALTVAGVFIVHTTWGNFWPWALPGAIANEFSEGVLLLPELLFGSVGGVLVALAGGWDVARRDVL